MTDSEKIQSDARLANEPGGRIPDPELPEEQQHLLQITENAHGVRKRLKNFFWELHHPFSNADQTVKLLRDSVLNDLWFFINHKDSVKAMQTIMEVFNRILDRKLTDLLKERLITTLVDLMDSLYEQDSRDFDKVLDQGLETLERHCQSSYRLFCRSSRLLKAVKTTFASDPRWRDRWFFMLKKALQTNVRFWKNSSEYDSWMNEWVIVTHSDLSFLSDHLGDAYFTGIESGIDKAVTWNDLVEIQDWIDISDHFRKSMQLIRNPLDKTYFVLYLLKHSGMVYERDTLIRDLNRVIQTIHDEIRDEEVTGFIDRLFEFFERLKTDYMGTVLDCILTLGKAVFARESRLSAEHFIDKVIHFGFVPPKHINEARSWQSETDPNHIKCLRVWLEIIECEPARCLKLIIALIVNIRIKKLFIADTDLFQRDVTNLLNAPIEPVYQAVRELARLFPVYFNEIGAEGVLRVVTTRIDEESGRQDRLIHYLRKQIHTESNNTHILLVKDIARFWYNGDPAVLKRQVPADVACELAASGKWFEPVHQAIRTVCKRFGVTPEKSLMLDPDKVHKYLESVEKKDPQNRDIFRLVKLIELHQLLEAKYSLNDYRILELLKHDPAMQHKAQRLENMLAKNNVDAALHLVFGLLQQLRKTILNPEQMQPTESIYQKRHIAVGIPSMYGRYAEPKFEALGLSFRLEALASNLMAQVIQNINLKYISAWTLRRIVQVLSYFQTGFRMTGIVNEGFNTNIRMLNDSLETTSFSISQYLNLFQFLMRSVRQIIQSYCIRPFEQVLRDVLIKQYQDIYGVEPGPRHVRELHGQAEIFYRDVLGETFLISQLDTLISRILDTLNRMSSTMEPEIIDGVMTFDPDLMTSSIHEADHALDSQIFLGAKGYFLKRLHTFHFPVPNGFVLTTEMYRRRVAISRYPEIFHEVFGLIKRRIAELESRTGKLFGDPLNPLLLSVRSGAAISLPGAMTTFLNVGLNDNIVEKLSCQPNYGWTSWDCYRRFLQTWGMAYGINRDKFDQLIIEFKKRYNVEEKMMFTNEQMRTIALAYKDVLTEHGIKFEEDPFRQIMQAIMVVMDSWNTDRARIYQKYLQISADWGTAVIVQQMVLGNINVDSGTGVVFTHDPLIREPGIHLYGDFTLCSQGEDVVAGLVHTLPISEHQRKRSPQKKGTSDEIELSLEKDFPEIYRELLKRARQLVYTYGFGHQEIEFTFETAAKDDLYILQTRDHSWGRDDKIPVFRDADIFDNILGTGIGISKGAMNGVVVFDQEDLKQYKNMDSGTKRILVRPDTVPDDIGMIFDCDGLLTARGGAASHAAVTAVRLGKTCVVNCKMLTVLEKEKRCLINGTELRSGDRIAIDGRSGHIYKGHYSIEMAAPLELP